jgi:hypothetical protein
MHFRFSEDKLIEIWRRGIDGNPVFSDNLWLRWIIANFEIKRSLTWSELQVEQMETEAINKVRQFELLFSNAKYDLLGGRAPPAPSFYVNRFPQERTVYGFVWTLAHPFPQGRDPLWLTFKYSQPVVVSAGGTHGVAHKIRFGEALVVPP